MQCMHAGISGPKCEELATSLASLHAMDAMAVIAATIAASVHNTQPLVRGRGCRAVAGT